jgi:hypothetical protein
MSEISMRTAFALVLTLLAAVASSTIAVTPADAADQAVIVPLDVDVYGVPEDDSTKQPQPLGGGSQVLLVEQRNDGWCHVASGKDPVPGGEGWIWCGLGGDNQDYSVQPVPGEPPAGGGAAPGEPIEPGQAG